MSQQIEQLRFLSPQQVNAIRSEFGSPVYVYDHKTLETQAKAVLNFPNAFGLTARYAMKASPNAAILRIFSRLGLQIDASSEFEVHRAVAAGVKPEHILLTAQEIPSDLEGVMKLGISYNACSLAQLENYGKRFSGGEISVRINPGVGSGSTQRTNVGGPSSSFGIWHEFLPQVKELISKYQLRLVRVHTHIGSGSDPAVWQKVAGMSLELLKHFPSATILNLGGGFKVARMSTEKATDLQAVGGPVREAFLKFANETGRKIHLEIEPGTFLVANSCSVISTIQDVISTGSQGYRFLKINSGMTEVTRPSLYGAQHPLVVVPQDSNPRSVTEYIVAGHCCESGDIFTPAPGDPEALSPRPLLEAKAGDALVIEGSGAYCSGMSTKNYNSFPEAAEVLLDLDGTFHLIRRRQKLEEIMSREVMPKILK